MKFLKVRQNASVRTIALNRPDKRNAFDAGMIAELTAAFAEAADDPNLRAVMLTGEGKSFCAGGDLEWMRSTASFTQAENLADAERLFALYDTIRRVPVPVLGRAFGHAFGGGAGLLAVCDVVAADENLQISFSEVKWGLVPAVISPFVCERASAHAVREWFLTAKVFGAAEGAAGGLINFFGAMTDVDAYLETTLNAILQAAPGAVREAKRLHQSFTTLDWPAVRARVTALIAERRVSAEGQEGLRAFLERRQPPWIGGPFDARQKI